VKYEGLPPLEPKSAEEDVLFINVKSVWAIQGDKAVDTFSADRGNDTSFGSVFITQGGAICLNLPDEPQSCGPSPTSATYNVKIIDLEGGSIAPGLLTFGSAIGTEEIRLERSTNDGPVFDALQGSAPKILGETPIRAVDGLQFEGRNTL